MNRLLISVTAFLAVTIGASTAAEAKRLRLRWLSSGAHDEESGVFWFIVVGAVVIGIAWVAFKAVSNKAKQGDVAEHADQTAPSVSSSIGKLARSASEARSSAESAWANKALARVEERGQQVVQSVGATPRSRPAAAFKPVGAAVAGAQRTSFGKRQG